jgi:predicted nucleotidyltransferase
MTSSSPLPVLDLPPERPVEGGTIALLRDVKDACLKLGVEFVLPGATARDIQMWHRHGIKALIAMRDVDVAVCAVSWEFHERLVTLLIETGRFTPDPKEQQKLLFKRLDDAAAAQLDLVPIGPLEAPRGQVAWPPDGDIVMTVLGFREAVDTAKSVNSRGACRAGRDSPRIRLAETRGVEGKTLTQE